MQVPGFIGPSNYLRAEDADAERTINWFPAGVAPGVGKVPAYLAPVPGLKLLIDLKDPADENTQAERDAGLYSDQIGVGRGIFTENGRTWVVTGGAFWEVDFLQGLYNLIGLVAGTTGPVYMASNGSAGHQLFLTAGGSGYIYDLIANTLTKLPVVNVFPAAAGMCAFIDGYFFVADGYNTSRAFARSKQEDGTNWVSPTPAELYERSMASDNIVGIARVRRELWVFGNRTAEVWVNVGTLTTTFAPLQNTLIEMGCSSAQSIVALDMGVAWVGPNKNGNVGVWLATGYEPQRISTDAIDYALNAFVDAAPDNSMNIRCWMYRQDGHTFYVMSLTDVTTQNARNELAYVCDLTNGLWHERARWNIATATWNNYPAAGHVTIGQNAFQAVLDHQSAKIYTLDRDTFTNSDGPLRRVRRCNLPFNEHAMVFISRLELVLRTGIGLPWGQGMDPQVMIRLSKDGGLTWGNERWMSAGKVGTFLTRVIARRLGQARNWMLEVVVTDPVFWALLTCNVDITPGTQA